MLKSVIRVVNRALLATVYFMCAGALALTTYGFAKSGLRVLGVKV